MPKTRRPPYFGLSAPQTDVEKVMSVASAKLKNCKRFMSPPVKKYDSTDSAIPADAMSEQQI
jgi:hypothetical protein